MASSTTEEGHRASFLGLPPELRTAIYEFAFTDIRVVIQNSEPFIREPGLLCANKQVRGESRQLFYATSTFELPYASRLPLFAKTFDQRLLGLIQYIYVEDGSSVRGCVQSAREQLGRLNLRVKDTALDQDSLRLPKAVMSNISGDQLMWLSLSDLNDFENAVDRSAVHQHRDTCKLEYIRPKSATVTEDEHSHDLLLRLPSVSEEAATQASAFGVDDMHYSIRRRLGNLQLPERDVKQHCLCHRR